MKPSSVLSNARHEILELTHSLRETLTKGRPEFEALIRRTRWGDGPLYMVGSGAAALICQAGARAFETYLGRPVLAREALDFRTYSLSTLQPRSVLLAISHDGRPDEMLETAQAAQKRGATVVVLTASPESELARMANGLLLIRGHHEEQTDITAGVCQQAVLDYLGLLSGRILRRPDAHTEGVLREFENLPNQAEWMVSQLRDALCALASESRSERRLYVTGAGFYHDAAKLWSWLVRNQTSKELEVLDPCGFAIPDKDAVLVLLSGSHCRLKRKVLELADICHRAGLRILSITDGNERELVNISRLTVLLPVVSEISGSMLSVIALAIAAAEGMQ